MAQNEMRAKPALPERVRSMEGLGVAARATRALFEPGGLQVLAALSFEWRRYDISGLSVDKLSVLPIFVDCTFCIDPEDDSVLVIFDFNVYGHSASDRDDFTEGLAGKLELNCPWLDDDSHWLLRCIAEVD